MTTRMFSTEQIGVRLQALRDLHKRYDHAADAEATRLYPDGMRLKRLKVSRLAVKDEIAALESRLASGVASRTGVTIPAV